MIIAIVIALLLMLCQVKNATLIDCQNDQKWKLMKTFSSRKSSNSLTSFGEYTKSTTCENTQERERNPSNNEISLIKVRIIHILLTIIFSRTVLHQINAIVRERGICKRIF